MNTTRTINIGKEFSRYPVGRTRDDGESNGERFREDYLRPALVQVDVVRVEFDDALGYNSSFLEEVFGGLVRSGFTKDQLSKKIVLVTKDDSLLVEIKEYIENGNA